MTQSEKMDGIPFNWNGWFNSSSGYGIAALEYACALERLTGKVSIEWERKSPKGTPEWKEYTDEQKTLFLKPFHKEKIGIIKATPEAFNNCHSDFRIGYTMIESTRMSKHWVDICNGMNMIFVPCEWNVRMFKENGVTVPVKQVRQGISVERYPFIERPDREIFTFGMAAYLDDRKNWQDITRAFMSEFSPHEKVRLLLKNNNPQFGYWQFKDERIRVIHNNYSYKEMTQLYELFDAFIFVTRGEGAGMPPREAMATGLPTIVGDYSGTAELVRDGFSYGIKPIAVDFKDIRGEQPGMLARYDIAEMMYWMRYVYEHQEENKKVGKRASEWMHRDYNWDECAKILYKHLKGVA